METDSAIMDSQAKIGIIQLLCEKLSACYIFPEVAERICAYLQACLQSGEYDDLRMATCLPSPSPCTYRK